MRETIARLLAAISKLLATLLASTKTHKWWWAGGGGAAVVAIAAAIVVFGGFLGPSGKAICTATLERARAYGVVPYTATLAGTKAKSTDVKKRRLCTAQAGDDKYNMAIDLKCKDMSKAECIALYSVERADGLSTYQVRKAPPDDGETAADAGNGQAAAADGGDGQGTVDNNSDIQPATGTNSGDTAPQQ